MLWWRELTQQHNATFKLYVLMTKVQLKVSSSLLVQMLRLS